MVLESTMICFDNSDFMRNGDYIPTRLHAQKDAVIDICYARRRLNPQNEVGLMTLADVKIIASLTNDIGTVIYRLQDIIVDGKINLEKGLRVAHMALRHRPEKHFKARIILLVGSPIEICATEITKVGKTLRKENIYIDIVSFGEINQNEPTLSTLFRTVSGKEDRDCSYIKIVGPDMIEELKTSVIMAGQQSVTSSPNFARDLVNNVEDMEDQDLLMALQLSLAEENRRQNLPGTPVTPSSSLQSNKRKHENSVTNIQDFSTMTEEDQIAYVLRLSAEQDEENKRKILKTENNKNNESQKNKKIAFKTGNENGESVEDNNANSDDSDSDDNETNSKNNDTKPGINCYDKKCTVTKNIEKNPEIYGESSKSNNNINPKPSTCNPKCTTIKNVENNPEKNDETSNSNNNINNTGTDCSANKPKNNKNDDKK